MNINSKDIFLKINKEKLNLIIYSSLMISKCKRFDIFLLESIKKSEEKNINLVKQKNFSTSYICAEIKI